MQSSPAAVPWFFALNDAGNAFADYCLMAQVAVRSARRHASLRPIFLFDGQPCDLTRWMQEQGVQVVHHRTSVYDRLVAHAESSGRKQSVSTGAGAFLRLDIPEICDTLGITDTYALYTDCDVLFRRDPVPQLRRLTPEFFAAAPQSHPRDWHDMNSGVLWMNLPRMRQMLEPLRAFVCAEMDVLRTTGYDQAALRAFYGRMRKGAPAWDRLPLELNWKPHWGRRDEAVILHFHGPKPTSRTALARGASHAAHRTLARADYYRSCVEWDAYAHGLRPRPATPPRTPWTLPPDWQVPAAFDAADYLSRYPDVARAVSAGHYADAYEHYRSAGIWEGREAAPAVRAQLLPQAPGAARRPCAPPAEERAAFRLAARLRCELADAGGAMHAAPGVLVAGPAALARRLAVHTGLRVERCTPGDLHRARARPWWRRGASPQAAIVRLSHDQIDVDYTHAVLAGLRRRLPAQAPVVLQLERPVASGARRIGTAQLTQRWTSLARVRQAWVAPGGDRYDVVVLRLSGAGA